MFETASKHFREDLARGQAVATCAAAQSKPDLASDLLRAAVMFGVGAVDAFFCDAYADLLSRALRARDREKSVELPERLGKLKMPVVAVMHPNDSWRWRMAARELIEDQNVLSISRIQELFAPILPEKMRLVKVETVERWIIHKDAKVRCMGISSAEFRKLPGGDRNKAKKKAVEALKNRFEVIFQRRHDCIHNCDRPKSALKSIDGTQVAKILDDIEFLVARCSEDLDAGFREFLRAAGFSAEVRNRVT